MRKKMLLSIVVCLLLLGSFVLPQSISLSSDKNIEIVTNEAEATPQGKYPTAWTYNYRDSYTKSKKMKKAVQTVMVSGFASIITGGASTAQDIAKWTITAALGQFFVNSDTEDIVIETKYYFRELGPSHTDKNTGIMLGNFENKKDVTTYVVKDGKYKKLGSKTYTMKTTQVYAF